MRLNIPQRITPEKVLWLVTTSDLPDFSYDDARGFDLEGKELTKEGEIELALCHKIIAARGYDLSSIFRPDADEGICFDKAATLAHYLAEEDPGYHFLDFKCSKKALDVYETIRRQGRTREMSLQLERTVNLGLKYTLSNIENAKRRKLKIIAPEPHEWFPEHTRKSA